MIACRPSHTAPFGTHLARLEDLFRQSLTRQEDPELVEVVDRVRALSPHASCSCASAEELHRLLAEVDLETGIRLVRAFSTYFHLANVAQQVDDVRALAERRARRGGWLARTVDRIAAEGVPRDVLEATIARLEVWPVFTAHPTEASRRSMLDKLRRLADLLQAEDGASAGPRSKDDRIAEIIDLMWQTDE
ncbi:MAG: phosphoenolpyruvate carboxylase, partial [Chloroflexota bacterium]|nr:phosphoenolpyruvate carboxylase [Chloroflexota bacterium]